MRACRICCYVLFTFCLVEQWTLLHGQRTVRSSLDKTQANSICKRKDSCTCVRSDGTGINLHFLDTGHKPRFSAKGPYGLMQWNPCTGFKVHKENDVAVAYRFKGEMFAFGSQKSAKFGLNQNVTTIEYSIANTASSQIILFCNDNAIPTFAYSSQTEDSVTGVYNGPCNPKSGISVGSLIVIAFFAIIIIYFTIGCIVNVYVRKAAGNERIPNYSLWSGLLKLIRDGCCFTVLLMRRKTVYEEI